MSNAKKIIVIVLLIMASGCAAPQFSSRIVPLESERVDRKPYLGVWKLTELFGKKGPGKFFALVKEDEAHLRILVSESLDFSGVPGRPPPEFVHLVQLKAGTLAQDPEISGVRGEGLQAGP